MVAVREDLDPNAVLCQSIHAAHEAGIRYGNPADVSSVVVVTVGDESTLLETAAKLDWKKIRYYLFREPDLGNQATALATEPLDAAAKKFFSKYQLWVA